MTLQTCPNCGHRNSNRAIRCKNCKAPLKMRAPQTDRDSPEALLDQTIVIPDEFVSTLESTKPADETIPVKTSDEADDSVETPVDTSPVNLDFDDEAESQFGSLSIVGDLILTHEESNRIFRVPNDLLDEVVIGRKNRQTGFVPTVDLSVLEGHSQGVSRRHATLMRKNNWLMIVDHSSKNGTSLNGQPLAPEQPRIIRDGDIIRIGLISLLVSYEVK